MISKEIFQKLLSRYLIAASPGVPDKFDICIQVLAGNCYRLSLNRAQGTCSVDSVAMADSPICISEQALESLAAGTVSPQELHQSSLPRPQGRDEDWLILSLLSWPPTID